MFSSVVKKWMTSEVMVLPFSKLQIGLHVYEILFKVNGAWMCSDFDDEGQRYSAPISLSTSNVNLDFVEDRMLSNRHWSHIELSEISSINFSFSSQFIIENETEKFLLTMIESVKIESKEFTVSLESQGSAYPNALLLNYSSKNVHF